MKNGGEQCDHGKANSDLFYSGCTTDCRQTSLLTWLDGKDPNGDGTSVIDGKPMPKWVDKARGIDAIQLRPNTQPLYATSGIGGLPGMLFDGVKDSFTLAVNINDTVIPNLTVVAVFANAPGNPTDYAGVWGNDNLGWDRFMVSGGFAPNLKGISNGAGLTTVTGLTAEGVSLLSVSTMNSGTGSTVHVGGKLAASFTENHTNDGSTSMSIGDLDDPARPGYGSFDGVISEIMIFNRALTTKERNTLGALLAAKYGFTRYCGDGVLQATEACDDGVNEGTGCKADCTN